MAAQTTQERDDSAFRRRREAAGRESGSIPGFRLPSQLACHAGRLPRKRCSAKNVNQHYRKPIKELLLVLSASMRNRLLPLGFHGRTQRAPAHLQLPSGGPLGSTASSNRQPDRPATKV